MWINNSSSRFFFISPRSTLFRSLKTVAPRVRFAPSPTGYLHLGGLRTALYNYLYAKSRGGVFILRIEDTDQTRKVEGSVQGLINDLEWAGIECNEGPGKGVLFGPYVQSERLDIYQEHIKKLLDNGSAYRCFCTERRLNILRRDALRHQRIPKYDNKCRTLSLVDIEAKMKAGSPYCIRFKPLSYRIGGQVGEDFQVSCWGANVGLSLGGYTAALEQYVFWCLVALHAGSAQRALSSDCMSFEDLIFGGIAYDVSTVEGDPVLMKSDGYPTYHFANVVDDHLMEVSHVLRGVEWQISTTKHLLIYKAFGWTPPQFGHLPLIVNSDGTKLSKRQNDVKVEDHRNKGIFPLALVNYITLSGGGFDHVAGEGVRLKTMDELATEFQIKKISSHPSRLNPDLLEECNRLEIKRHLKHENLTKALIANVQNLVTQKYPKETLNISEDHIKSVLDWSTSRISRIEELVSPKFAFLWILPSNDLEINKILFEKLLEDLENLEKFEQESIKDSLRRFSDDNDVKYPVLMKMLRSALSGLNEGPSVAEMMQLLGKCQSLERIKAVIR